MSQWPPTTGPSNGSWGLVPGDTLGKVGSGGWLDGEETGLGTKASSFQELTRPSQTLCGEVALPAGIGS